MEKVRKTRIGRNRAEQTLREMAARFQALAESANEAIIIADGAGNIISWNKAAQCIFLYTEQEMLGQPITRLMPERYLPLHEAAFERRRSSGEARIVSTTYEAHGLRKDGSEFPAEISLASWEEMRGQFFGGIIRDVTERKEAENEIRRSLAELQTIQHIAGAVLEQSESSEIMHTVAESIVTNLDCDTVVLLHYAEVDHEFKGLAVYPVSELLDQALALLKQSQLTGDWREYRLPYTPGSNPLIDRVLAGETVIGDSLADFFHPWIPRSVAGAIQELFGTQSYIELPMRVKGHTVGTILAGVREGPITADQQQALIRVVEQAAIAIVDAKLYEAAWRESAERKNAEDALRGSEKRFRALIEHSADAIWLMDSDGSILYTSPSTDRLLGYDSQQLYGRNISELLYPEDQEFVTRLLAGLLPTPNSTATAWFRCRHKDGSWRWVEGVGTNLLTEPSVRAVIVNLRDITERKQRQREREAIATLTPTLRAAATRAEILPIVLDQTLDLLKADSAALAARDPASGETAIELARGGLAHAVGMRLPPGKGVCGHVMATGQPFVGDASDDPLWAGPDSPSGWHAACAPLIAEGQVFGALLVGCISPRPPLGDEELRVLAVIGDIAASAIHRSSLHERTRQLYGQLESRERFISRTLDSIPSSLVVIDRALRVVSVNHNFLEKARREASVTLGHKIEEVFPQVLMEYTRLDRKVRDVFRSGRAIEGGKVAYRAPGLPTRIYYYRLIPLYLSSASEGGEVENVMLLMDDITEREQLGEEVRRVERRLASVVECANDLVISLDSEGRIVTWNRAAERTSGLTAEQAIGQSLLALCANEHRPVLTEMLRRLTRGEGIENTEVDLLTTTGEEVPIAWSTSPMRDDAGEVMGIVAVGRDLTERRRLEAQLIHAAKMASLGVMAGGIAHELRNPLGIISATAQLLLGRPSNRRLRDEGARKIHAATQRASLIIENLLKFARPQSEQMREIDLRPVLKDTFTLLAHQLDLHEVTLKKEIQPDLPEVRGNPALLQQVFTNLILNACNAMPEGGSLTVAAVAAGADRVEIRFCDTGRGIAPEHRSKIFDPFFTTMPVGKGTGLGLSISYGIIQQHQGDIEVDSQVGKGTTFTIRLPRVQSN